MRLNIEFDLNDVINKSNDFLNYISRFRNVVYLFHCTETSQYYVGITNNIFYRLYSEDIGHLNFMYYDSCTPGSRLQLAINKYGVDKFKYSIIFNNNDYKIVSNKESEYIKLYNSCYNGFNCSTSGKMCDGDIRVNNGQRCIFIKPWEIDEAYENGFTRRGSLSSSRIEVTDGSVLVSIYKDEFKEYKSFGFTKVNNRKVTYLDVNTINLSNYPEFMREAIVQGHSKDRDLDSVNFTISGKIGFTDLNTGRYFLVNPSEVEIYETNPDYKRGNLNLNLKKGDVFVNKDGENKRISPFELDKYLSIGWERGFKLHSNSKRVKLVLDDLEIQVSENEIEAYLVKGYKKGGKSKKNITIINLFTKETLLIPISDLDNYNKSIWMTKRSYTTLNRHENFSASFSGLGKIYVHNDTESKRIDPLELEYYISNGYKRGKGSYKNK